MDQNTLDSMDLSEQSLEDLLFEIEKGKGLKGYTYYTETTNDQTIYMDLSEQSLEDLLVKINKEKRPDPRYLYISKEALEKIFIDVSWIQLWEIHPNTIPRPPKRFLKEPNKMW